MPPKFDPNEVKILYLKVYGGCASACLLAPKVGPLGLSARVVAADITKVTSKDWKNFCITVKLEIKNRQYTVEVVPTASALVLKALEQEKEKKKARGTPRYHTGNLTMKVIIEIARIMRYKSMAKKFSGTVKEILGTAKSIGCTVDGVDPRVLQTQISNGDLWLPPE